MYSQVDSEGKQYRYFVAIINPRKNTKAVDKVDQFRTQYGKKTRKKTTTGWNLEVEWKDGTTSWLPLKEIKETNPVEVANYAISNQLDTEPAHEHGFGHESVNNGPFSGHSNVNRHG